MASLSGSGVSASPPPSTPVKWTLVEAEPETPEGRRGKQRGSGPAGSWRSGRDAGRGRGGQGYSGHRGNRRGGGARNNQGQGRGRGYGGGAAGAGAGYMGGATYYAMPNSNNQGNENQSFEEQKVYMTSMAARQVEFYFTVENLCRDIFMRSYMDEEGFIPIAFVANFPGVARFGVELQDITAGILASELLEVDTENETMRMREGWEVWLLPNQATGKRGVPRYIKVDPETTFEESASAADTKKTEGTPNEAVQSKEASGGTSGNQVEGVPKLNETKLVPSQKVGLKENASTPREGKEEKIKSKVSPEAGERPTEKDQQLPEGKTDLAPTAPVWTPNSSIVTKTQTREDDTSATASSPTVVPRDDEGDDATCLSVPATKEPVKPSVAPQGDDANIVPTSEEDEATDIVTETGTKVKYVTCRFDAELTEQA